MVEAVSKVQGVKKVIKADAPHFSKPIAENIEKLVLQCQVWAGADCQDTSTSLIDFSRMADGGEVHTHHGAC